MGNNDVEKGGILITVEIIEYVSKLRRHQNHTQEINRQYKYPVYRQR